MSCRSYNCPSNWTKEKSSVSVRLKYATSPFFAASTKLFSAAISVASSGLRGLAGAFACPTRATVTAQQSRIMKTTKPYFIPVSLLRLSKKQFVTPCAKLSCSSCHSERSSLTHLVIPSEAPLRILSFRGAKLSLGILSFRAKARNLLFSRHIGNRLRPPPPSYTYSAPATRPHSAGSFPAGKSPDPPALSSAPNRTAAAAPLHTA